jgi:hypothetical protein
MCGYGAYKVEEEEELKKEAGTREILPEQSDFWKQLRYEQRNLLKWTEFETSTVCLSTLEKKWRI